MEIKKIRIRKEKIALLNNQIKDFLTVIKEESKRYSLRNYIMAKVWFAVGFRVSEICNFTVNWIEYGDKSDFIHIKSNTTPLSFKPKYGSTRRIAISKQLTKVLTNHLAGRTNGYIFKSQKTSVGRLHTKYVITMFNKYFVATKSIGRSIGSHTFRRTFASQLATSNPPVPIPKISYYLGHKNIQTTIGYLKKVNTDDHSSLLNTDYIKTQLS